MYILADIGGTKTRIAGTSDLAKFTEPIIFETPQTYEEGIDTIIQKARECAGAETIEKIAVGIPGVIAPDHRSVETDGNLPDWKNKPIADMLESALGGGVSLENDTALCGLGEAHHGAGRDSKTLMYLTVSTGVGGVRIKDGRIDAPERSAEIGYQYLSVDDPLHRFSELVSGRAIAKRYGVNPRELGKDHAVWEELARIVAIGLNNSIIHWTPDRVVLGGSMFNEIGISVDRVQAHLKDILRASPEMPKIVHSQLGDVGGLWGGMARLKQI